MTCIHRTTLLISAALLSMAALSGQSGHPNAQLFGWQSDLNKAKALAKKAGKPMFVVFRCEP